MSWKLTEHVCRNCFGRIVANRWLGITQFMCADCGMRGARKIESVCACGAELPTGEPAGMNCEKNPEYKAGVTSMYCATYHGRLEFVEGKPELAREAAAWAVENPQQTFEFYEGNGHAK